MTTVQASKAALRKEIQNKIRRLTAEQKNIQSEKVAQKLLNLPVFQNSQRVSVFLSTSDEINTEPIIRKIFEAKKKCYVPRYDGKVMEMVRLNSMKDWEDLPLTKWNIKQPALNDNRENAITSGGLDLLIIPGMAFTTSGKRLGRGKGYYDGFLKRLFEAQKSRPSTIAVAFKEQILNEVPTDDNDVMIDHILYAD